MEQTAPSNQLPPWVRRAIVFWWFILVGLWVTLTIVREVRSLLIQIVFALFLSFAMEPMVDRLGRLGLRRGMATAVTMLTTIVFFVIFLTAMGSLVANQIEELAEDLPGYVTSAELWAEDQFNVEISTDDLLARLNDGGQLNTYLSTAADNLVGVGTSLVTVLFQVLTIGLFAFYFTADGPRLRQAICSVLPPARQMEVLRVWELAINKTGAYISSRIILALISALVHWVAFISLGLPSPVPLALWVGLISQFIPVVGIYIAGVIPALIALGVDPISALWVVIVMLVYQQIENYVIQPRITAQTLNMHPAVAFGAVLAGSATFGATGALLALPFVATVQSFISAYIARHTVVDSYLLGDGAEPATAVAAANAGAVGATPETARQADAPPTSTTATEAVTSDRPQGADGSEDGAGADEGREEDEATEG